MAGKLVDQGENKVATVFFNNTGGLANMYLGLYTNATEPAETATLASLTEITGGGYARKTLAAASWTVTADVAQFAEQSFTASGGSWTGVYGYFLATTIDGTGLLLFVETMPNTPYNVPDGGSVRVTPKVTIA